VIDVTDLNEPKLNLSEAARYFAPSRKGRPPHKSRILRYMTDGVVGPDGVRVFLGGGRLGYQWVTTPSAIQAFCEALTPKLGSAPSRVAARKAAERAGDELAERGI
jgi:hypothetical protein